MPEDILFHYGFSFPIAVAMTVFVSMVIGVSAGTGVLFGAFRRGVPVPWRLMALISVVTGAVGELQMFGIYHYRGPYAWALAVAIACGGIVMGMTTMTIGWRLQRASSARAAGVAWSGVAAVNGMHLWVSLIRRLCESGM